MTSPSCPGAGTEVKPTVAPAPGVRDLRHGRAPCPVCHRTLALTSRGRVRHHAASPVYALAQP